MIGNIIEPGKINDNVLSTKPKIATKKYKLQILLFCGISLQIKAFLKKYASMLKISKKSKTKVTT